MRLSPVGVLAACLVSGCAVGPAYKRPPALGAAAVPAEFGDAEVASAVEWKAAGAGAPRLRGAWWELFEDAELSRLEALAAAQNQQVAVALANHDEAQAAVRVARADFFPQVNGAPSATRQRGSANNSPGDSGAGGRTFSLFNVSADASWELDLWGRIRRGTEGARDRAVASAEDLDAARLSVQAEVGLDYFTLRALDAESRLLADTAAVYRRALELTRNRRQSGVASALDVAQAETQLRAVEAQIPAVDLQRAQTRHALAVLCGEAATGFGLNTNSVAGTNLPAIPRSVPSEWLESRPDIAAAERRMAAANADVGVAQAAFYPRVLLNGSAGLESVSASTLFDWPSRFWAVGPSLQWPLFTGGRTRAQLTSAKAAYAGAVAGYRQIVLQAFQDVEDRLAADRLLASQLQGEAAALEAARRALDISNNRYKAGVAAYLDVVAAQTAVLGHEQNVVQLRGQRLAAGISLIKALGGGWDNPGRRSSNGAVAE